MYEGCGPTRSRADDEMAGAMSTMGVRDYVAVVSWYAVLKGSRAVERGSAESKQFRD